MSRCETAFREKVYWGGPYPESEPVKRPKIDRDPQPKGLLVAKTGRKKAEKVREDWEGVAIDPESSLEERRAYVAWRNRRVKGHLEALTAKALDAEQSEKLGKDYFVQARAVLEVEIKAIAQESRDLGVAKEARTAGDKEGESNDVLAAWEDEELSD